MADSTPYVLAAGALTAVDKLLIDGSLDLPSIAATGFAAIALAALDVAIPGLGKGVALVGLVAVVLTRLPSLVAHIPLAQEKKATK